ncbi:MAG TPA: hypothetical protein PK861_01215 [Thermomonas sp.]|nr:hypothetical protein [Thermomonas sp.]
MSAVFAQLRTAGGAALFGAMGFSAPSGPGRITSGALVWNNNVPHRAAPIDTIVRSADGMTTVVAKTGLTTAQDSAGDWVVTFQDAAIVIGQWYRLDHRRTDIGVRGAIGTEFVQATA